MEHSAYTSPYTNDWKKAVKRHRHTSNVLKCMRMTMTAVCDGRVKQKKYHVKTFFSLFGGFVVVRSPLCFCFDSTLL